MVKALLLMLAFIKPISQGIFQWSENMHSWLSYVSPRAKLEDMAGCI